jgi:hypothetical protein
MMLESEPPLARTQIAPGFFSVRFWAFLNAKDDPDPFNKLLKGIVTLPEEWF